MGQLKSFYNKLQWEVLATLVEGYVLKFPRKWAGEQCLRDRRKEESVRAERRAGPYFSFFFCLPSPPSFSHQGSCPLNNHGEDLLEIKRIDKILYGSEIYVAAPVLVASFPLPLFPFCHSVGVCKLG